MTKYLDRKALEILSVAVPILRIELEPHGYDVSDADEDSPYSSERGDRGAFCVITRAELSRMKGNLFDEPATIWGDARVEIQSADGYEGLGDDGRQQGWGFGFACTENGGAIGPGRTIANYSDAVWTKDRNEIRERLGLLRDQIKEWARVVAEYVLENSRCAR